MGAASFGSRTCNNGEMNEEVRKRLDEHRARTKARADESAAAQEAQTNYDQWRHHAIDHVLLPAREEAITTLREAGYIIAEQPTSPSKPDQWDFVISSPHSGKDGRTITLSLDRKGVFVYSEGKATVGHYAPRSGTKDDVVELIVDQSTLHFVPGVR